MNPFPLPNFNCSPSYESIEVPQISHTILKCLALIVHCISDNFFLYASISVPANPPTLGTDYTLTCSAIFEDLSNPPMVDYQWMDPDGNIIVDNPSEFITISDSGNSSSLVFHPVQLSQGGQYTCDVIMNSTRATNFATVDNATGETHTHSAHTVM
jgi:hypothetical protein